MIRVVCVAVPHLAPELIPEIAGAFCVSQAVVTAVGVGLVDAAAQELCVGIGLKDHFSLVESITAGITAGFASGFGGAALGEKTVMTMVRMGMVNVSEQLTEMAIGVRQQFDLAGVALAMGSAGLSPKIKLDNPLAQRMVSDIAVAGMSSVVRGRFDVESLATQLITDAAAVGMQQRQTKPVSDDYQESQKASRGAGKITQTTIEQQWENQLINDAEFTANTQLPSVTFDINNSDISQQLGQRVGEEISHFYHPTPPPARNANGFWRGVDNILEMQEGSVEAASLVFTGSSEAPKNRWQKAGYAIGVPLAFGAQIVMAGERMGIEAVEAIENVYQGSQQVFGNVTSKLERWGLFGKQIAPDMPTFGSRSLLEKHFEKHAGEFKSAYKSPDEYLIGAHNVIKNGIKVAYEYKGEIRLGYAKFMGTTEGKSIVEGINNPGVAKFEFVGTNLQGDITTYFTPSGKNFWNIINNNSLDKTIVPYEMMKLEETPQFISQFMKP